MNFIDGVIVIEESGVLSWIGYLLIIAPIFIVGIIAIILHIIDHENFILELVLLFVALCCAVGLKETFKDENQFMKPTGEYVVVATAETDMQEFVSTYEIVDYTDGKYTIKLK